MPWYYAVAERDHDIQDPTSAEKIRHLGRLLRLGPGSRVLDVACGKAGPALVLAEEFGCSILGVERAPEFVAAARERIEDAGLSDRIEIVEGDARAFPLDPESWDAALCLGASFVFDDLEGTLAALAPAVRPGGHVAVGEPYWREWPLPREVEDEGWVPMKETVARIESAGLALVGLVAASDDDWDRYESLHWSALEEWLAENPVDPDAIAIRERHEQARDDYLSFRRRLLGWAIFAGRKS
ncbi:MAG: class I SAM-dependent methyltransferase [Actinobacteria bacterium]|nr:class I SAM-dependent methyltransferase [Actinomycetota bacterium]